VGVVLAGDVVVAPSGSDRNPCTAELPCASLAGALAHLPDGGTIFMRSGTYTGPTNTYLKFAQSVLNITRYPDDQEPVMFVGNGTNTLFQSDNSPSVYQAISLSNLEFSNATYGLSFGFFASEGKLEMVDVRFSHLTTAVYCAFDECLGSGLAVQECQTGLVLGGLSSHITSSSFDTVAPNQSNAAFGIHYQLNTGSMPTITLQDLRFSGGSLYLSGFGIHVDPDAIVIQDLVFHDMDRGAISASIYGSRMKNITVNGCDNVALELLPRIDDADYELSDIHIMNCGTQSGMRLNIETTGKLTIQDVSIIDTQGGISIQSHSTISVSRMTFSPINELLTSSALSVSNTAAHMEDLIILSLSDSELSGSVSATGFNVQGEITNSTINSGTASMLSGNWNLTDVVISYSASPFAIGFANGKTILTRCLFEHNKAAFIGENFTSIEVIDSKFQQNHGTSFLIGLDTLLPAEVLISDCLFEDSGESPLISCCYLHQTGCNFTVDAINSTLTEEDFACQDFSLSNPPTPPENNPPVSLPGETPSTTPSTNPGGHWTTIIITVVIIGIICLVAGVILVIVKYRARRAEPEYISGLDLWDL